MNPHNKILRDLLNDYTPQMLSQLNAQVFTTDVKVAKTPEYCLDDFKFQWQVQDALVHAVTNLAKQLNNEKARQLVRVYIEELPDFVTAIDGDLIRICVEYRD